ncbi:MAG: ATP synthase subunit I [Deltaproteobacteria bacterium]|nr:ATP synthase subunit I [Deltaproteobacteria bacterium]
MFKALIHRLDALLWQRGFHRPEVRLVMRNELLFSVPLLLLGLCLLPLTSWLLWFATGALLIAWNFYGLARVRQGLSLSAYSQALLIGMLVRSQLRLVLSALFLYGILVWFEASVWAVVAGITGAMGLLAATSLVWLAEQRNRQKEA